MGEHAQLELEYGGNLEQYCLARELRVRTETPVVGALSLRRSA